MRRHDGVIFPVSLLASISFLLAYGMAGQDLRITHSRLEASGNFLIYYISDPRAEFRLLSGDTVTDLATVIVTNQGKTGLDQFAIVNANDQRAAFYRIEKRWNTQPGLSPIRRLLGTAALRSNGELWLWWLFGNRKPVRIEGTNWTDIALGWDHVLALKKDETVWAWGQNGSGQLGIGTIEPAAIPTLIETAKDWKAVAARESVSFALKTNGTLWAWGGGERGGDRGDDDHIAKYEPVMIGTDEDWAAIIARNNDTMAIKTSGTLWAWGPNTGGELGDGTTLPATVPLQIGPDTDWSEVSFWGGSHTVALKTNGTLWTWGYNLFGALGDGTQIDRLRPARVGEETNWVKVAAGGYHTVAIKRDGSLWGWGANHWGQLGVGVSITNSTVPLQVGNETNWTEIDAAAYNTIAAKRDGTIWSWGGLASNPTLTPVLLPGPINAPSMPAD